MPDITWSRLKAHNMIRRLIPKPHMLKSIRARNWNLAGAIEELVDNSIGHGKATAVRINIKNEEGISVTDNGIGLDNINRIFHYGDASAHDDLKEIGQYGVGAKNATIYLGDCVIVSTAHDGRYHVYNVDWSEVERSQEWPAEYLSDGRRSRTGEIGTTVLVRKLARHYQLATSEKMVDDFGIIFAPALRKGVSIEVRHTLANGTEQILYAQPFSPDDLTDIVPIYGEIETRHGLLSWSGTVGLSTSLVERHNGIHIAFGHRVIESTRDPFRGKSAPTLYAEIQLDDTTPWKHQLSEHKDKVVRYREELMTSIHEAIKDLLDKSSRQAQNLALNLMIAPIESALNKALKGVGDLFLDPNEDPMIGGERGEGPGPEKKRKRYLFSPVKDGEQAKEIRRPTGISFDWRSPDQLEGRAYAWELSGALLMILLDETLFAPILDWPPTQRNDHITKIVVGFASNAIQMEYLNDEKKLKGVIDQKLINQISTWMTERTYIAPRLMGMFLRAIPEA